MQAEFRLARRYGELVYQRRYVTTKLTRTNPWWKIWAYEYHTDRTYGNWADIPIPEIGEEENNPCYCYNCADQKTRMTRMIVCPKCGNKRCPHATDHSLECTNSNEPNQPGSRY